MRFQRVLICVADADLQIYAEARLRSARVDMQRVRFVEAEYDDTWLRDSGPITLTRARRRLPAAGFPLHRLGRQVSGQP